jgi:hypothetical protein
MNKRFIAWSILVLGILGAIAAVITMKHRLGASDQMVMSQTYQIGQDLIAKANSPHLAGLPPGLSGQLSKLLGSPTQVSTVLLGDEPPPVGDGSACSRLILTNQQAKGLELRLCAAQNPGKLRVMGYWPTSTSPTAR